MNSKTEFTEKHIARFIKGYKMGLNPLPCPKCRERKVTVEAHAPLSSGIGTSERRQQFFFYCTHCKIEGSYDEAV